MSRDALVVGISAYQWLPGLNTPALDAEAIAQQLQTNSDFRVTRMPDTIQAGQSKIGVKTQVTLAELEAALVRLFKPKGANIPQTALFYFSGHGLQKDAGIQEGYLATSDVNPASGFYGLSLFWLRRLLQESPVKQRIILLDCCHSGELLNFLEADPGARSGTDRLFMAASREYESAYESIAGTHSIFTQAVLEGLDPRRLPSGTVTNYALTDWVSTALKTEMQQPLFENSGSEIILTRCQNPTTVIKTELAQEVCPYRGLECFDEAHAEFFFGREDLTDQLIERLKSRNFVAVLGASGSGKSSLVRAGLIHQLRQGHKFSGSDRWRIQLITPTDQPLKSLATAFVNSKAPTVDRAEHLMRAETLLREGGTGLCHLVRASLISSKYGRNSRLLLIIDQFEEVFTLCQGPQAERDRHRFFNSLITALQEANDCLSVVIVLRADFFGKCSLYNGLATQIEQNLITVTPLTYEQIKASIVKPAQKAGLTCDPNLVYNILMDIVGSPGELPLLQYTLLELWQKRQPDPQGGPDRLTLDAYTELGGVRGTLQKRANEIFYSLNFEEQEVAKRIFIALTQLGEGTEDTRRRILKSELVSPRFSVELVEQVLEKLVMAKLVITSQATSSNRYQERLDQGLANVSTALRFAQMRQGKSPNHNAPKDFLQVQSATLLQGPQTLITELTQLPSNQLADLTIPQMGGLSYQETVDVAHETLIRHWALLRSWLDESRETLRRQRRIEHQAKEWHNAQEPRSAEYLLQGDRLIDAKDYSTTHPDELSGLAQRFLAVSKEENHRTQKELRLLQLVVPCTLLAALMVTIVQYRAALKSQAEKDYQLRIATSRQQAAIAQSILQEPNGDSTTALLISRLAAEKGGRTNEAQASLRAALQKLQLQANLIGHDGAVHQISFSPNQRQFATAGDDGTIRIWSLKTQSVETLLQWEENQKSESGNQKSSVRHAITSIAFSPDGRQIAAIAKESSQVRIWSVESGSLQFKLEGADQPMSKLAFSPSNDWIAAVSTDNVVRIWHADNGQMQTQFSHPATVTSLAFSLDGQQILSAGGATVQLWQPSTGKSLMVLRQPSPINDAQLSPDGQFVAAIGEDGNGYLWQMNTRRLRHTFAHRLSNSLRPKASKEIDQKPAQLPTQVVFSPDSKLLATVDDNRKILLWNVNTGQLQAQVNSGDESNTEGNRHAIAFSPDSQRLVTLKRGLAVDESDDAIHLWDAQTGHLIERFQGLPSKLKAIQFSHDGALIATASETGSVQLWATEMGSEFPTPKMADGPIQWAAFRSSNPNKRSTIPQRSASSPMGQLIRGKSSDSASGSAPVSSGFSAPDQIVTVAATGSTVTWTIPQKDAYSGSVTKDPSATAAELRVLPPEKNVRDLLKLASELIEAIRLKIPGQSARSSLPAIETPPSDRSTAALNTPKPSADQTDNQASSVNPPDQPLPTGEAKLTNSPSKLSTRSGLVGSALSHDGQLVATVNDSGRVEIWQVYSDHTTGRLRQLEAPATQESLSHQINPLEAVHAKEIRRLSFSFDNQKLLGIEGQTIYLWDVSTGKLIGCLQGHTATIEHASFSHDGQQVVSASDDHTARIWQISSSRVITTLHHQTVVSSAQFSPDDQLIATASWDGTARLLDAKTGALRVILAGHRDAVLDAEFSPDGQRLITASADGTARLWDTQTGMEETILRSISSEEASEPIQRAFFSPDGRYVLTLSKYGRLHLWAATWEELLELARDRSIRQLQPEECLRYLRLAPTACPALEARK